MKVYIWLVCISGKKLCRNWRNGAALSARIRYGRRYTHSLTKARAHITSMETKWQKSSVKRKNRNRHLNLVYTSKLNPNCTIHVRLFRKDNFVTKIVSPQWCIYVYSVGDIRTKAALINALSIHASSDLRYLWKANPRMDFESRISAHGELWWRVIDR